MKVFTLETIAFLAGSVPVILLSWRSLGSTRNHGFYRFFAWELMLWMLVHNVSFWFREPWSFHQILSWILLVASVYPVVDGLYRFRTSGRIHPERNDPTLFGFEHTTRLITSGIYRYIRHPMYASLLYLSWGIALKNPSPVILVAAALTTILLYLTVRTEERENLAFFGEEYAAYMRRTKRFIPRVW